MSHSSQVLRTLPLIGNISNTEFKSFLQKSAFSLDKSFIKDDYLPKIKTKKAAIEIVYGDETYKASGYDIFTTDYVFIRHSF